MEKVSSLDISQMGIKLICWDLDGTLFDTESAWYKMHDLVVEKYGLNLSKEEMNTAQEKIAADMYRTIGYRANADKALLYFKNQGIHQSLVNPCPLTNKTMMGNQSVISQFGFDQFDSIVSEDNFSEKIGKKEMYLKAMEIAKIIDSKEAIAIEDLPDGLESAKNAGMITIWARNKEYPFTKEELSEIEKLADYYVDDFSELIK